MEREARFPDFFTDSAVGYGMYSLMRVTNVMNDVKLIFPDHENFNRRCITFPLFPLLLLVFTGSDKPFQFVRDGEFLP